MATDCKDYEFQKIEAHWQGYWARERTFRAEDGSARPKCYVLDMFPYPSGAGLHIGHPEGYTASDILSRYKRAAGFNVLHPMGWDAFGLPAEQYAVKTGTHPRETTVRNIANFRRQIERFGFAIDWEREVDTTDPSYYRWTQWIFLQLFRKGLAYVDARPVWFCPQLGTVLANEEIVDGKSEVGGFPVERRALRQWVLRITAYADALLDGLKEVAWPESTKTQQANWIGRSEGAEVSFGLEGWEGETISVFTTRPDTLFGATYMVLAPEHRLVATLTTESQRPAVEAYVRQAACKSDLDRTDLAKEKTGVFTGSYAINPVNGARLPVWIADYVLLSYGTGAIMAVPGHDVRDFEFATRFQLPITPVVARTAEPGDETELPYTDPGFAINSGDFNGLPTEEVKRGVVARLSERGQGKLAVNYKLRDWLFARQRYWGEPFPMVWVSAEDYGRAEGEVAACLPEQPITCHLGDEECFALPIPPSRLPVVLPATETFQPSPTGESPLSRIDEWVQVWFNTSTGETLPRQDPCPSDGPWVPAQRETNTMPQWAGSCWYYLRFCDPRNSEALIDPKLERYWQCPDFYIGGAEHAVLHLLYARFWHRFLYDLGVVTTREPFPWLFHQGLILGEDGEKMSKSRGNVVNPDSVIAEYGADALRLYEMFMGPLEDTKPWSTSGIDGPFRFLRRLWRELLDKDGLPQTRMHEGPEGESETIRLLNETVRKVTEDIERLRLNTAISQMMIFLNHLQKQERFSRSTARTLVQLLAPFAPHIAEELWARLGGEPSVSEAPWPSYDPGILVLAEVKLGVLVNGRPRGEVTVGPEAPEAEVLALARAHPKVVPHLEGRVVRKVVYVPGKVMNLVVS